MMFQYQRLLLLFILLTGLLNAAVTDTKSFKYIATPWSLNGNPLIKFKYVHVEDYVTISCQTNDPNAQVNLQVRKSRFQLYENTKETLLDERIIQNGQNFTIKSIKSTDSGQYQCEATSENKETKQLTLGRLYVSPNKREIVPEVFPNFETQSIESDEDYNISCKAPGSPGKEESYLMWYKRTNGIDTEVELSKVYRHEEKTADNRIFDVEILMFQNFQPSNAGTYVCKRIYRGKSTEKSVKIVHQPDKAPTISLPKSSKKIVLKEKEPLNLVCTVDGSPAPNKYWKKDNNIIFECPNKYNKVCRYSVQKAQPDIDSGEYECVAENKLDTVQEKVTVNILELFKYIAQPWTLNRHFTYQFKYVHVEDYIPISCQTNDPKAQVKLQVRKNKSEPYKNAKEILVDKQSKSRIRQQGQNFIIKNAKLEDSGQYQCKALSEKGESKKLLLGSLYVRPRAD